MGEFVNGLNAAGGAFVTFAGRMLIQSSILIVILAALDFALRKRVKAVVRYWIWLLVLAKLLLPPSLSSPTSLVSWVGSRLPETSFISSAAPGGTLVGQPPSAVNGEKMAPEGGGPTRLEGLLQPIQHRQDADATMPHGQDAGAIFPIRSESVPLLAVPAPPAVLPTWQALVLLVWLVAVLVMGTLLIQRAWFVRGLMAQAEETPDTLRALLEQCRRQMPVRGQVDLRLTALSASPALCGLRRPVILIPEAMIPQLQTPQLRSVLLHELAHLRRGDLWINLLQTLLQIVYLYHPLLWWANARIRAVREQAVDETVLAALGEEAEEYPRTLVSVSRLAFGPPALSLRLLGVVESEKALTARIRHMVSRPFPRNARVGLLGLAAIMIVALILLPMARGTERSRRGTSSLMDRLQKEEDSELAELIRTAMENRKNLSEQERLEIVRKITQGHAQIMMLDAQIAQVAREIEGTPGSAETPSKLSLTKREFETKRMTEMANLRELMGIIPKIPFGPQPVKSCSTYLRLNVVDQRVYVTDTLKPFHDYWVRERLKSLGLLSESETLDLLRERLKDKENLPVRIDVLHSAATSNTAGKLRDAIVKLLIELNAQMEAEVRLKPIAWVGSGESPFFVVRGTIMTLHAAELRRPDGGPKPLVTGVVDPNDLEQHILWRLLHPGNVPLRFRIEYDEASNTLAKQVADLAKAIAKRLGIAELVEVTGTLVEPVSEIAFLGRWQALGQGEVQTIDVQPGGVCQLTRSEESGLIKAGASVSGTWLLTTREILIDTKEGLTGNIYYVYRGYLDKDGNLVFDKGVIDRQGGFGASNPRPMVLKKVQ